MEEIIVSHGDCFTTLAVHEGPEAISQGIRRTKNFYENSFLDFILKNYKEQVNIIDIGANIGNHSLFFKKFLHCEKVYSFEPFPKNVAILRHNMKPYTDCEVIPIALSSKEGHMTLYNTQGNNFGGFSLHNYQVEGANRSFVVSDSVEVKTLDSFALDNITMIKIDVENHENDVLEGARETILRNKPIIFIENLYHVYPIVCPDINVQKKIFDELDYVLSMYNIVGSFNDLWVPNK